MARPRAPRTAPWAGGRTSAGAAALAFSIWRSARSTISAEVAREVGLLRGQAPRASPRHRLKPSSRRSLRFRSRIELELLQPVLVQRLGSLVERRRGDDHRLVQLAPSGSDHRPSCSRANGCVALERGQMLGQRRQDVLPRSPRGFVRASRRPARDERQAAATASTPPSTARRVCSMTRATTGAAAVRLAAMPSSRLARCAAR